jgi:F-type H+-transporting ATPase subunit a
MQIKQHFSRLFIALLASVGTFVVQAGNHGHDVEHVGEKQKYDPVPAIMHHISDAYDWHLWDVKDENGHEHAVSIPLPVILIDGGLHVFLSSEFDHGHKVVEKAGNYYALYHNKIYKTDAEGSMAYDESGHVTNARPIDLSITKNAFSLLVAMVVILLLMTSVAKYYKRNGAAAPRGLASFIEPLIIFVRDDIALSNIGEKKYAKFVPYLLTLFFFIWINNLLGLIPFFPGGANVTGNIAVTLTLAFFTLILVNINGNKEYWGHIFWMPGVPVPVRILLAPIEIVGIFTKPFALMIRLFANITAGHIIVLSLISLIFIFESVAMGVPAVLLTLFISVLELLVAALQAYIFTMLTALFVGMAVAEHDHH